jgi:hypothetical protein
MASEWGDSPDITREMWRERARELERLLVAERESHAITRAALFGPTSAGTTGGAAHLVTPYPLGTEPDEHGVVSHVEAPAKHYHGIATHDHAGYRPGHTHVGLPPASLEMGVSDARERHEHSL